MNKRWKAMEDCYRCLVPALTLSDDPQIKTVLMISLRRLYDDGYKAGHDAAEQEVIDESKPEIWK